MGTSVAMALRQRLSFALNWQRVIVQLGPLIVMSFLSARSPWRPTSEQLRNATGGRDTVMGKTRVSFAPKNQRSIICQVLGDDYLNMALSHFPSFISSRSFSPLLSKRGELRRLSNTMNCSSRLFDQVVWPTARSGRIVNVSMCLLLCVCAVSSEKNKWPRNETGCKMTHPLFQSGNEAYWKGVTG